MNFADVVLWKEFPFQHDGIIKRRWFVCLGEFKETEDPFDAIYPILVILCTTTTLLHYYEAFGERHDRPIVRLSPDSKNGFEAECILDLASIEHRVKVILTKYEEKGDITVKGRLSEEMMKKIYATGIKSGFLSQIDKDNLYKAYTGSGIVGLERPRRIR